MPDAAEQIRCRITRGDYVGAAELWDTWIASLAAREIAPETLAQVRELYDWGRGALLAQRVHLMAELNAAHAAEVYRGSARLGVRDRL